jgi:hypothetical protein
LTRSVFVLWPFYTPMGGLYTNLREGLAMPFEATYGFLLTLGLMVGVTILAARLQSTEGRQRVMAGRQTAEGVSV